MGTLLPFFTIAKSTVVLTVVMMLLNARVFNFEITSITLDRAGIVTKTTSSDKLHRLEDRKGGLQERSPYDDATGCSLGLMFSHSALTIQLSSSRYVFSI